MNLSVKVDLTKFKDVFGRLPVAIERAAVKAIKQQLTEIQKYAQKNHRFMSVSGVRPSGRYYRNTGMLDKSISTNFSGNTGMVYLETGIAEYGPYVHEGHGTWGKDQFIYGAMDKQESAIVPAVMAAVEAAVKGI